MPIYAHSCFLNIKKFIHQNKIFIIASFNDVSITRKLIYGDNNYIENKVDYFYILFKLNLLTVLFFRCKINAYG